MYAIRSYYANRLALASALTLNDLRLVARGFKRQNAGMLTSRVASTASFNTEALEAGYIAVCHVDVENDIRALPGFRITSYNVCYTKLLREFEILVGDGELVIRRRNGRKSL